MEAPHIASRGSPRKSTTEPAPRPGPEEAPDEVVGHRREHAEEGRRPAPSTPQARRGRGPGVGRGAKLQEEGSTGALPAVPAARGRGVSR